MIQPGKSIRTFIGSKDFNVSCKFYETLEFELHHHGKGFAYVSISPGIGFYLQDYYNKEWCENNMVFLEVENIETYLAKIKSLNLPDKFPGVKVSEIRKDSWGHEFFVHDPAGVLWHIGVFKT
ncbi:glyoxalase [uncultured Algoriphagus sp.]|uniref:glyoxalase n=1 Tax=uncultured Algoriphagus sp. TaxID=417365 RepID=UPI0025970E43|nr:glyoxalase [uncultured Algoriphagus sp.]